MRIFFFYMSVLFIMGNISHYNKVKAKDYDVIKAEAILRNDSQGISIKAICKVWVRQLLGDLNQNLWAVPQKL